MQDIRDAVGSARYRDSNQKSRLPFCLADRPAEVVVEFWGQESATPLDGRSAAIDLGLRYVDPTVIEPRQERETEVGSAWRAVLPRGSSCMSHLPSASRRRSSRNYQIALKILDRVDDEHRVQ
jgi:hypothetical protein